MDKNKHPLNIKYAPMLYYDIWWLVNNKVAYTSTLDFALELALCQLEFNERKKPFSVGSKNM